jgi:hypothetical protein
MFVYFRYTMSAKVFELGDGADLKKLNILQPGS